RQDDGSESRRRVAGVEAARHVGRGDQRHQLGVERTALAEVAVKVNLHPQSPCPPLDSTLPHQDNTAPAPPKSRSRGTMSHRSVVPTLLLSSQAAGTDVPPGVI